MIDQPENTSLPEATVKAISGNEENEQHTCCIKAYELREGGCLLTTILKLPSRLYGNISGILTGKAYSEPSIIAEKVIEDLINHRYIIVIRRDFTTTKLGHKVHKQFTFYLDLSNVTYYATIFSEPSKSKPEENFNVCEPFTIDHQKEE